MLSDFKKLHPGYNNLLFSKWSEFKKNVVPLLEADINNPTGTNLIKSLEHCNEGK